jgi:hypothetical protein
MGRGIKACERVSTLLEIKLANSHFMNDGFDFTNYNLLLNCSLKNGIFDTLGSKSIQRLNFSNRK